MDDEGSTIENRVYLFKDLAAAFVEAQAAELSSNDPETRKRAIAALGELARICAVVADTADEQPEHVRDLIVGASS
jgi:hypothetical protein